jgi:hypothetical protein
LSGRQIGSGEACESLHPVHPFGLSEESRLTGISCKTNKAGKQPIEAAPAFLIPFLVKSLSSLVS